MSAEEEASELRGRLKEATATVEAMLKRAVAAEAYRDSVAGSAFGCVACGGDHRDDLVIQRLTGQVDVMFGEGIHRRSIPCSSAYVCPEVGVAVLLASNGMGGYVR